jgi:FkbM family methyltransferase
MNDLINVTVVEQALSDMAGKEVIARVSEGHYGQASIGSKFFDGGNKVRVKTTTLADILVEVDQIALMKMDLEGVEELALSGAGETLNRVRTVIFEDWGRTRLSDIFKSKGFVVSYLDGRNKLAMRVALE